MTTWQKIWDSLQKEGYNLGRTKSINRISGTETHFVVAQRGNVTISRDASSLTVAMAQISAALKTKQAA